MFGVWEVLCYDRMGKWLVECSCGQRSFISKHNLISGNSTRCDQCRRRRRSPDLTGIQIGEWTISDVSCSKPNGRAWWCLCSCGTEQWVMSVNLLSGGSKRCVTCAQKPKGYNDILPYPMWDRITSRAKQKGWELNVTKQSIEKLLVEQQFRCALSGLPIAVITRSTDKCTASLDRIDSSKGYVEGNVQWVHKTINLMKNKLSVEEFKSMCAAVTSLGVSDE